jgi:hypothetical protein
MVDTWNPSRAERELDRICLHGIRVGVSSYDYTAPATKLEKKDVSRIDLICSPSIGPRCEWSVALDSRLTERDTHRRTTGP